MPIITVKPRSNLDKRRSKIWGNSTSQLKGRLKITSDTAIGKIINSVLTLANSAVVQLTRFFLVQASKFSVVIASVTNKRINSNSFASGCRFLTKRITLLKLSSLAKKPVKLGLIC